MTSTMQRLRGRFTVDPGDLSEPIIPKPKKRSVQRAAWTLRRADNPTTSSRGRAVGPSGGRFGQTGYTWKSDAEGGARFAARRYLLDYVTRGYDVFKVRVGPDGAPYQVDRKTLTAADFEDDRFDADTDYAIESSPFARAEWYGRIE